MSTSTQPIRYTPKRPTAEELETVHNAAFKRDPLNSPECAMWYLEEGSNHPNIMVFAYSEERLAGYALGDNASILYLKSPSGERHETDTPRVHAVKKTLYVPLFATHPDFKGQGIGERMLKHLFINAQLKGYHSACGFFKEGRAAQVSRQTLDSVVQSVPFYNYLGSGQTYHFIEGKLPVIRKMKR